MKYKLIGVSIFLGAILFFPFVARFLFWAHKLWEAWLRTKLG
jgi:hypothetical protein